MYARDVTIGHFDPQTEDPELLRAMHALQARSRAEHWPEDPPLSYEETVRNLRNIPAFAGVLLWGAWRGEQLVGWASVSLSKTEDNRHLADCGLFVLLGERRRGLGSRMLAEIAAAARADGRRMLVDGTDSMVPSGEGFAGRLGAKPGLTLSISQLELAEVDRGLLQGWLERAPDDEFEIGLWMGPYPEEDLGAVIALREVMNTAPREDLDVEDFHWTAEHLREVERALAGRGQERWTLYARHKASGELVGYTEVFWRPEQAEVLQQGDTGVLPAHRGRNLGRWLKAAMLEKVFAERPQVKRVRTGNAGSNAAMLKINWELGFRERKQLIVWQVALEQVERYLRQRGLGVR